MTTSKKAGMFYFGIHEKWILEKYTPKEISLFFKDGRGLFAKMLHTDKSEQYLKDHPELAELIKRW